MMRTQTSSSRKAPRPGARLPARLLGRVWRSQRGAAALEFVLIVPLMLLVLLGFTELYLYMRTLSNMERVAFTLADSIGQMQQVITATRPPTTISARCGRQRACSRRPARSRRAAAW